MRLTTRSATVAVAAVLAFAGMPAAAAYAADGQTCTYYTMDDVDHLTSRACFIGNGDYVSAKDNYADGHRAVAHWETNYGRSGECHNTMGAGWTVNCDYDFAETGKIRIKSCVQEGHVHIDCTGWTGWIKVSTGEY